MENETTYILVDQFDNSKDPIMHVGVRGVHYAGRKGLA